MASRKHSHKCPIKAIVIGARTKSRNDFRLLNTYEEFDIYTRIFKKRTILPR